MPSNTFATSGKDLIGQTIDNGRLRFLSVLGVGAYGVVYLAVDLHAPSPVYLAVKCLLRAGLDSRQRHFQRREIALHQLASKHPNVVTLHKVLEEGDYVFVIMDFCDEGDLFGMITETQRYLGRDHLIKKIFLQIVDAVQYLHSMGIFHRDLKPENILCTKNGEKICIADFGLATSERTSTDFGCGSTFYLSPECQGGLFERLDKYSTETNDIWSLGVILVNLTCGRNPWRQACPNDETFRAYVHNPDFLRSILPISRSTNHILKGLFSLEPSQRTPLHVLRQQILAVESFTMSDDELRNAHSAARAAAAAVRPKVTPPAAPVVTPPSPAISPNTIHQGKMSPRIPTNDSAFTRCLTDGPSCSRTHSSWSNTTDEYIQVDDVDIEGVVSPAPSYQESCNAAAAGFGTIPFPQPFSHHHHNHQQHTPGDETPLLLDGNHHHNPYAMAQCSSRSSEESEDVSLPPTPEFNPADKTVVQPRTIGSLGNWDIASTLGLKPGHGQQQPHLLHVQPISPLSSNYQVI